jgi:BarA-like signal transduction histidine kinase
MLLRLAGQFGVSLCMPARKHQAAVAMTKNVHLSQASKRYIR